MIDTFCNWANYETRPPKRTGKAEKWDFILPDGVTTADLKNEWQSDKSGYPWEADDILDRVVDLLQIDYDLAHKNGHDFFRIEEAEEDDDETSGMWITILYFEIDTSEIP